MNTPSFLIVWAAKSGTTALYHYLSQHAEIYMSPVKETEFFVKEYMKAHCSHFSPSEDKYMEHIPQDFSSYVELFSQASPTQLCWEASVQYMYAHHESIPKIKENIWDPKIIIMVRDPEERILSAYNHLLKIWVTNMPLYDLLPQEDDFISEWRHPMRHFLAVSRYQDQIRAFQDNFTHVLVIDYAEFRSNNELVLARITDFLWVNTFTPRRVESNPWWQYKSSLHALLWKLIQNKTIVSHVKYNFPKIFSFLNSVLSPFIKKLRKKTSLDHASILYIQQHLDLGGK